MALTKIILAFLVCVLTAEDLPAQTAEEYQVKAAFLYNFAKFVEWPPEAFKGSSEPISICIFGRNPFGRALDDTVKGKVIDNRGFVVLKLTDVRQAGTCKILFVSSSERKTMAAILTEVRAAGALTVGETDGFATDGGVVNFKLDDGKVRIEINVQAAERERLHISSKLLSLAQIVKGR